MKEQIMNIRSVLTEKLRTRVTIMDAGPIGIGPATGIYTMPGVNPR